MINQVIKIGGHLIHTRDSDIMRFLTINLIISNDLFLLYTSQKKRKHEKKKQDNLVKKKIKNNQKTMGRSKPHGCFFGTSEIKRRYL